jgi:predicted  nucleic acid-binding Zn-ribbon protein
LFVEEEMRLFLAVSVTFAVCCLGVALIAQEEEKKEVYMPKGVRPAVQVFERDCPMCGWNPFKKRSSNKPSKDFEGAFKPGDTCPLCAGKGKIKETIDWAGGYAEAFGTGKAKTRSKAKDPRKRKAQDFLGAKRAAEVEGTRNAVRLLVRVRLNRTTPLDAPSYKETIEATVKGAEETCFKSSRKADLPYYIAKVKVPLWGVKGLTSRMWAAYTKSSGATRHAAAPRTELDEEHVIIIDARGTDCPPHLFPRIITEKGTVVYDISKVNKEVAQEGGMARYGYIEEDVPFEKLDESFKQSSLDGLWKDGDTYAFVMNGDEKDEKEDGKEEKKKKKKRRRKKINVVVKGKKATDKDASVTVSEADAKKMQEADEKSDSLKGGKVIILTDSRVAGKEGRIIIFRKTRLACRE